MRMSQRGRGNMSVRETSSDGQCEELLAVTLVSANVTLVPLPCQHTTRPRCQRDSLQQHAAIAPVMMHSAC